MSASPGINPALSDEPTGQPAAAKNVLLISNGLHRDRLADLIERLGMTCIVVPSYLSALGKLSTEPARVLIGPADAWHGSLHAIVDAVHAVSPGIRMVAVCESSGAEHGLEAISAGFDALWHPPFDSKTLQQVIEGQPRQQPGESAPSQSQPTQRSASDQEELGDVDLIDAILSAESDVKRVAIRMIESNSEMQGVGIRPADGQAPEGDASVSVLYKGQALACLHAAPPATEDQLYAWADWLSRWLALQKHVQELSAMALRDELTGVWNRRYFNRFLDRILRRAASDRSQVTLMVFDIDDFKLYNDKYGHGTGDEVLREAARLMVSVVREHDVVARIGGDEFAVIFWDNDKPRKPNSEHPNNVVDAARRFQEAICVHRFPKLSDKAMGRLTVSGGLASFPWDGRTPQELLDRADAMALQSKRQGKNAITFGTGAKRHCPAS